MTYAIFSVLDQILWSGYDKKEAIKKAKEFGKERIVTLYQMKEIKFK